MIDLPPPALRLRFDAQALADNWRALDRISGRAAAGAAVKADGYGLGASGVVPVLADAGARTFFVAHWSEVPDVLKHVPGDWVSVLHGPLTAADAAFARATGVRPVLNSLQQVALWLETGGGPCDLMVDTGINRLGLPVGELGEPQVARLNVRTLMSHLASADEDSAQNAVQLSRFRDVAGAVQAERLSLSNSAGIGLGEAYAFDLTRPGLALYGGIPRAELAEAIRPVIAPQAAILQVRELKPGDSVGYNARFTADRSIRAGVVSIGYADGFLRSRAAELALRHGDVALPLLGKISMDMVVIDLTAAPGLQAGDWVDIPYALPAAADASGLSQYELLTVLGKRFRR